MKNISYQFIEKLKQCSFIEEIWLFGSRARKDNLERSDIDLAVMCPKATKDDWNKVLLIVDEADTLLKIDIVRFDTIKDPLFKERIEKEKLIIYKKKDVPENL